MSIESITLHNFKSYSDVHITNLNPKINIILGQNGHGKSNFFQALLFLFSDIMSKNEMKQILYDKALRDD